MLNQNKHELCLKGEKGEGEDTGRNACRDEIYL